ncbi:hypothetical protein E6H34_07540 [Candidatus Bathyarchaeota archaeon]|nr:MAG: hypothetical protein E6H34_07540 [Candidatus Bathyarchaeota archaeon]
MTKTQVSVVVSYSMPFVLLSAIVINNLLQAYGLSGTPSRLVFLSTAFPIGFSIGRAIYLRWSHTLIAFDSQSFSVVKGSKEIATGFWRSYRFVSIIIDRYGRPNLRLYKSIDGDHLDLPISRTNVRPQKIRDRVQGFLETEKSQRVSPRAVEAA